MIDTSKIFTGKITLVSVETFCESFNTKELNNQILKYGSRYYNIIRFIDNKQILVSNFDETAFKIVNINLCSLPLIETSEKEFFKMDKRWIPILGDDMAKPAIFTKSDYHACPVNLIVDDLNGSIDLNFMNNRLDSLKTLFIDSIKEIDRIKEILNE